MPANTAFNLSAKLIDLKANLKQMRSNTRGIERWSHHESKESPRSSGFVESVYNFFSSIFIIYSMLMTLVFYNCLKFVSVGFDSLFFLLFFRSFKIVFVDLTKNCSWGFIFIIVLCKLFDFVGSATTAMPIFFVHYVDAKRASLRQFIGFLFIFSAYLQRMWSVYLWVTWRMYRKKSKLWSCLAYLMSHALTSFLHRPFFF